MRPRLLVVGPVPPPVHGVTVSTRLVLENRVLRDRFDVEHVDTSDSRPDRGNIGRWDVQNVALGLRHAAALARRLRGRRGVVYLPLSQSTPGFLRDSVFIGEAKAAGWRVTAHLRGSEFPEYYARQPRPLRRWIEATLGRLDSLAVMGESLRDLFEGLVPPERIAVVPNGTPDIGTAEGDGRTVLFLSNLRRRKGLEAALEAALLVLDRIPEARFVFAGEWESGELEREARRRVDGATDRISFPGTVTGEAKDELLRSAAVLLFPPVLPEGHPRVVLEALSAGVPVVATDRGAIAETVVDGESGYVAPEPEPELLAERVGRLLEDHELRERMARAARERYLARFTQEHADRVLADWLAAVAA